MTKTHCDTCGAPATVHGRISAFCTPCAEQYAARTARFAALAPEQAKRLINGAK